MKSIIVTLVLILMIEGCRSNVKKVVNSTVPLRDFSTLPIPYPKYSKFEDKSSTISRMIVRWDPVEISEDNPILGFKIKLWEDEKKKVYKYVEKDGEQVLVEELVPVKKSIHVLPTHEPALVAVVPSDVFTATFDVKIGVHYEMRGQSFNADGDGPFSNAYGFRLHTEEETRAAEQDRKKEKVDE